MTLAIGMGAHSDYKRRWWFYRLTWRLWPFHHCSRWHYDGNETRCVTCGQVFAQGGW